MENQPIEKLEHEITVKLTDKQYKILEAVCMFEGFDSVQEFAQAVVVNEIRCVLEGSYTTNEHCQKLADIVMKEEYGEEVATTQ